MPLPRLLHIKNAHNWYDLPALYTSDVFLEKPAPDALVVDLEGYTIFPGLVNAHDHLELNHFPRTKYRDVYLNAHVWAEEVQAQLDEPLFRELRAYPLEDKLFIGGLKNLLCGATTVAHHNPPHKPLFRKEFPVRVLQRYGWAHSLHFETEANIVKAYREKEKGAPFFIHLAEGTDEIAAAEYQRLLNLGIEPAIIIHGVGLTPEDVKDASARLSGIVWCPSTNLYLLDKTAAIDRWFRGLAYVVIGSDSRLSADGDLLDEIRAARNTGLLTDQELWEVVFTEPPQLLFPLQNDQVGSLIPNAYADWFALDSSIDFLGCHRTDLALVVKGGIPQLGDPDVMAKFPHIETVSATLDGVPKSIHIDLARRIMKCTLKEAGLVVSAILKSKRRIFGISI